MNIYSIYKATNKINGKSYIGFDSNWPKRMVDHKQNHNKNRRIGKFYNALKKYGWENFEWNVIYQSKDNNHTLNVMESFFIHQYNTLNGGYNMTPGGDGKRKGSIESDETRLKKSIAHTGKKLSKEIIKKCADKRRGHKHSIESLMKMSNKAKGRAPWNKGKKTGQIPYNKNRKRELCCCIVCKKEVDCANLGRHHKHLPKLTLD